MLALISQSRIEHEQTTMPLVLLQDKGESLSGLSEKVRKQNRCELYYSALHKRVGWSLRWPPHLPSLLDSSPNFPLLLLL